MRAMRAFLPAIVWAIVIWLIGGLQTLPSGDIVARFDKLAHFTIYGVLGWLSGRGWTRVGDRRVAVAIIALALLLGAGDEWRQSYLAARSPDVADWLADAAGVITGFLVAVLRARQRHSTE